MQLKTYTKRVTLFQNLFFNDNNDAHVSCNVLIALPPVALATSAGASGSYFCAAIS